MAKYVEETRLCYEIILSKGKGQLTPKAERMLILIANNFMLLLKSKYRYKDDDEKDALQTGMYMMFKNWKGFDEKRYKKAFPYFTEVCKRGCLAGIDEVMDKKSNKDGAKTVSIQSSNNGQGLHNV